MNTADVNITFLNDRGLLPHHGSSQAAGYDLSAAIDGPVMILPHYAVPINTGIAIELPEGTFGMIVARSGLATKEGLRLSNSCGIIDSDYRGELIVSLYNDSDQARVIQPHERIAQLIVLPYYNINFSTVEALDDTERGTGGFGSTGK